MGRQTLTKRESTEVGVHVILRENRSQVGADIPGKLDSHDVLR